MIADIGLIALLLGFIFAVYATLLSAYGGWCNRCDWVESARNAAILVFPLLTVVRRQNKWDKSGNLLRDTF